MKKTLAILTDPEEQVLYIPDAYSYQAAILALAGAKFDIFEKDLKKGSVVYTPRNSATVTARK